MDTINILTNRKSPGKIKDLELDITIRENHSFVNEITQYPVEDGSTISDHVRQKPDVLTIEGLITNTPIIPLGNIIGRLVRKDNSNRNEVAFNELLTMGGFSISKQPGSRPVRTGLPQLVDVVTTLRLYTQMIIEEITVNVDETTDNSIIFSVRFKQYNVVSSNITVINNAGSLNGKAKNIKNQNSPISDTGKTSTTQLKNDTTLYKAGELVKGLVTKK